MNQYKLAEMVRALALLKKTTFAHDYAGPHGKFGVVEVKRKQDRKNISLKARDKL